MRPPDRLCRLCARELSGLHALVMGHVTPVRAHAQQEGTCSATLPGMSTFLLCAYFVPLAHSAPGAAAHACWGRTNPHLPCTLQTPPMRVPCCSYPDAVCTNPPCTPSAPCADVCTSLPRCRVHEPTPSLHVWHYGTYVPAPLCVHTIAAHPTYLLHLALLHA